MPDPIVFQTYASQDDANSIADKLLENGIAAEVLKATPQLGREIIGNIIADSFLLKIPAADFNKANNLLYSDTPIDLNLVDWNHPLRTMSNNELLQILAKPDEWGADNYRIAYTLLESKGMNPTSKELEELKKERKAAIARAKTMNPTIIGVGYIMALTPAILWALYSIGIHLPFFPGFFGEILWFFGLIISFVMIASKTTLPDGNRVNTYTPINRIHGMIICAIYAITILVIFISEVPVR